MIKQGLYDPKFEHDNCGAGFICNLKGKKSNEVIHQALEILIKLEHRGAVGPDGRTGDGAGILIEIPDAFFRRVCEFELPKEREYAVGMTFLPTNKNQYDYCIEIFKKELERQELTFIGIRRVRVDMSCLGEIAAQTRPRIRQIFIGKKDPKISDEIFKKKLFIARKITENKIANSKLSQNNYFYFASLSTTTIIYKGLLVPQDIGRYYKDLNEPDLVTKLALVHQRFSTNTFPSWDLAQPFRYMCHNGEINTLKGNVSRMRAREEILEDILFGDDLKEITPIIREGKSDSASMDMAVELLLMTGRSLPEVMMMMVPEAWQKDPYMDEDLKAFYQYNSCIMEPWDGPASIPFTDGDYIGAILDRNGLRPSRYTVTKDGNVIMASETGVVKVDPSNVVQHGRLEPGRMFLVDMNEGRIIENDEIKQHIIKKNPYKDWVKDHILPLKDIPLTQISCDVEPSSYTERLKLFSYTSEDISTVISPMAKNGKEALGSMGMDTPIAVLSEKPQLLFNYFKQLFAQVTNPPLDGIREEIVTDVSLSLGKDYNLFDISAYQARKLEIQNPIISNDDLEKIKNIKHPEFKSQTIELHYDIQKGVNGLEDALENILKQIQEAVSNQVSIIILSDRGSNLQKAPIPILLACSYVHHKSNQLNLRSQFDIVIESAAPREPHHFATLFGYGASAINPYMVNEIIANQVKEGNLKDITVYKAIDNFNIAIRKGLLKVMNKIGISTLQSYRGSQIFEILGLNEQFCKKYFPYTATRIEGIGLYEVEKEVQKRHQNAFPDQQIEATPDLNIGGDYRWRRNGEKHLFNPTTIAKLQQAVRQESHESYQVYSKAINEQAKDLMTLRGLFEFDQLDPISIDEVEPWTEIVKRFKTGAMSYGSISQEAHENLAIAMNRIGGKSNSGEGGEIASRFKKMPNGDSKNSAIKQVASGRFGVTSHYLSSAKEIQIKMAQGAKPGEGGQLPGEKVYSWVAEARNSTPYVGLISPPPHHDIYSIEDLAQLIYDLKNANREARINVKLVSEAGVGTIAAGVAKAKADVVLISGYDGGTGASPLTSLKHAGLPWELGLAEAQQTLVLNNLRSRIVVECDGQLKTGRDVAIACLLGAEEFGFATAPLVASGCIMMRACHLNTCPVGIATQDPELRKNFKGTPEHVINFMYFVAQELREIMAQLGFRTINDMVGQVEKLNTRKVIAHYKAKGLDLSAILKPTKQKQDTVLRNTEKQNHHLDNVLDIDIVRDATQAIRYQKPQELYYDIRNTNRSVGAITSNEISKIYGAKGLAEDCLKINFKGSAGQSFAAFATKGMTLTVEGETNDYLGKGLSGAKVIVKKPKEATFNAWENIITGNVSFFGGVSGHAYVNGIAGERFCVRNSGVTAVVEGIGDHGCEYMTGGNVIILGKTGKNFASGMSGGIAYVYDPTGIFKNQMCNTQSVDLVDLEDTDLSFVKIEIENHQQYTDSQLAKEFLENWTEKSKDFVKVYPWEYRQALDRIAQEKAQQEIENENNPKKLTTV